LDTPCCGNKISPEFDAERGLNFEYAFEDAALASVFYKNTASERSARRNRKL